MYKVVVSPIHTPHIKIKKNRKKKYAQKIALGTFFFFSKKKGKKKEVYSFDE